MSLPAVTPRLYSSDEIQFFSYLRSLYFDRDVSFENEYQYFYDRNIARSQGFHETFLVRTTDTGRRVNYATIGCALLWSPFYAIADLWTRLSGGVADGFSKPYLRAVACASALYGFVAILLSIKAARLVLRDPEPRTPAFAKATAGKPSPEPLFSGFAVWLGTPLLFYMYVAPPFSHAVSAFGAALFVTVWLHVRREWTPAGMFALGVCAALLAMIREQDVFIALAPAVDLALTVLTSNSHRLRQGFGESAEALRAKAELPTPKALRAGLMGVLGFLIGYVPQLLAYNAINGYPGPAQHVARKMFWYAPHGLQVLFSPHHGFFFWTPLAILAIVGLFMLGGRIALCALIMIASQVYVAGSVASWTVAGAFGQRRFVCLTPLLVVGIAGLLHARPEGRAYLRSSAYSRGITVAVVLCIWWNIALMAQFATGQMDRQRLEPTRNAYHAFVTLPLELPSLVYRYFTDRSSFYKPQ